MKLSSSNICLHIQTIRNASALCQSDGKFLSNFHTACQSVYVANGFFSLGPARNMFACPADIMSPMRSFWRYPMRVSCCCHTIPYKTSNIMGWRARYNVAAHKYHSPSRYAEAGSVAHIDTKLTAYAARVCFLDSHETGFRVCAITCGMHMVSTCGRRMVSTSLPPPSI